GGGVVAAAAVLGGCGPVAGRDREAGAPAPHADAAGVPAASVEAGTTDDDGAAPDDDDGGIPFFDSALPPDAFFEDANDPTPDAADAACTQPSSCDDTAKPCCAPAVCNAD